MFIFDGIERLTSVYIMLGAACNMRCRHCIEVKMPRLKKTISSDVLSYLKELTSKKKLKLVFFGGEPLLYKDQMQEIINVIHPQTYVTIITNGLLLNNDIVNWINDNNIAVAFSNDGPNTDKTGRNNLLEDPEFCKIFSRIKHRGIEGVIHAYSQDFEETFKYFYSKIPDASIYMGDLVVTHSCPDDYVDFDPTILRKNEDLIIKHVNNMVTGKEFDPFLVDLVMRKAKILNTRASGRLKDGFACGVIGHTINIDLQGNIFLCHACDIKLGTIYEPLNDLMDKSNQVSENIRLNFLDSKGCNACEARDFCAGKCPLEPPSKNQHKGCEAVISLWRAVDKSIKVFGDYLNDSNECKME